MKLAALLLLGTGACLSFASARAEVCPAPANDTSVAVPGEPFGMAVSSDDCWMFVSTVNGAHGNLVVLHDVGGTYSTERTISLGGMGTGEALTHNGKYLVVTAWAKVELFDTRELERATGIALLGTLDTGERSGEVYAIVSRDDHLLFVSEEHANRIAVFDLKKWRADDYRESPLVGYVPAGLGPVGLALSPDGRWLYATSEVARRASGFSRGCKPGTDKTGWHSPGLAFRIDVERAATDPQDAVSRSMQAGCNPVRVAVSPDGAYLWVSVRGSGDLYRISTRDLAHHAVTLDDQSYHVGGEPVGVAVRPDGKEVWVALSGRFLSGSDAADRGRQLIGILGIGNKAVTSVRMVSEPASGFPRELEFLPDGRTLAVSLFGGKRIEFITTPP